MAVTADNAAPYAPAGQILEIVKRYRDRGNPRPITAEAIGRLGVPDSLNARTMQALRALDLIDEGGEPTNVLEGIRLAPETDYQKTLQEWLTAAYSDIFSIVDPATDDETKIKDAFRNYVPSGQRHRIVSLFLGLCEEAGIRKRAEKSRDSGNSAPRKRTSAVRPAPRGSTPRRQKRNPSGDPTGQQGPELPPALSGLLHSLPDPSKGWTQADRDKFYTAFGTMLDFCFPIRTQKEMEVSNGDDDEKNED